MQITDIAQLISFEFKSEIPQELLNQEPIGFSIDSRTIRPGEMFFAIRGEFFNGHNFVKTAFERGACAAVICEIVPNLTSSELIRCLQVQDSLAALQMFAHQLLSTWKHPVIGITGSMGKTTTKELTAAVLGSRGRVHKSLGNLNNGYGLPLTILKMISDHRKTEDFDYAVLEMGMSYAGEIKRLCEIAPPIASVVLNVAPVHLENFLNIEGIAAAKAEIIKGLTNTGTAILNADDPLVCKMTNLLNKQNQKVIFFGQNKDAQIRASKIVDKGVLGTTWELSTPTGTQQVNISLPGTHFVYNALAAAAVGFNFGISLEKISQALASVKSASHRGEVLNFQEGFTVVDDSYNSNPSALNEMIKLLGSTQNFERKILIAGEMLELGPNTITLHEECGQVAANNGIEIIIGVGLLAQNILSGAEGIRNSKDGLYYACDFNEAADLLNKMVRPKDLVLIKGSRAVKLDGIITLLKEKFSLENRS